MLVIPSIFLLMTMPSANSWHRSQAHVHFSLRLFVFYVAHLRHVFAQMNQVDLSTLSNYGGAFADDNSGRTVRFAGDVDGDGHIDVLIGEPYASVQSQNQVGQIRLLWGPVNISNIFSYDFLTIAAADGTTFIGAEPNANLGKVVEAAGDVDNDGYADLIFSESRSSLTWNLDGGRTYLWFGRPRANVEAVYNLILLSVMIRKRQIYPGFVTIEGRMNEKCGSALSSAGDVDKDGYDDILIGCKDASPQGRTAAGRTYLCYGRIQVLWFGNIDLTTNLASDCLSIDGFVPDGMSGYTLASGDVNNDTFSDVIIGAPDIDAMLKTDS